LEKEGFYSESTENPGDLRLLLCLSQTFFFWGHGTMAATFTIGFMFRYCSDGATKLVV